MENKALTTVFYNSEKNLFLAIVIIGAASILAGILFYYYSKQFKAFAITLMILGLIETVFFGYQYSKYDQKIEYKQEQIKTDQSNYHKQELSQKSKSVQTFLWLKIFYSILISIGVIAISLTDNRIISGILIAVVLHLSIGLTIDNFAERYTKDYLQELIAI